MKQSIDFIIETFHDEVVLYSGFFAVLIAALIYLFVREQKGKQIYGLMWFSLSIILVFCFPVFAWMSCSCFAVSKNYYHLLWFLPVVPVLGFVFVDYFGRQKSKHAKIVWVIFCIFLLECAGSPIYLQAGWYEDGYSAQNPDLEEQIGVCEFLHAYDHDAVVVVRKEFLPLVRQVSGEIRLVYGYDIQEGYYSEKEQALFELMQTEDAGDMEKLIGSARELGATYLIMDRWWVSRQASEKPVVLDSDVQVICVTDHYQIFAI